MHILLASAYFPPDVGAASHLFLGLGKAFIAQGHRVSVVTGMPGYYAQGDLNRYKKKLWISEQIAGIQVYRIRVPQVAGNTPVGRGIWQFSYALALALRGLFVSKPDIALVYSPPLPLGLSALVWRALRRIPFVVNVQDLFPQSAIDLGVLKQRALISLFQKMERLLYRKANGITVHSEGNRRYILAHGGADAGTIVIPNTVDVDHIKPGTKNNRLRRELGLNGRFIVSFAGVMGFSQDLDTVIEAAGILKNQSDIQFLLVGDGVEKRRLLAKSEAMDLSNITWLPMQPRERYPDILQSSDVGLVTLHTDVRTPTVPSKILSNFAAARPVIASLPLFGDAPKLIKQANAGVMVPPESPNHLAQAILSLYHNTAKGLDLGLNGRQYVVSHFSHATAAKKYESLFKQLVQM